MKTLPRRRTQWLAANVAGMVVYLYAASRLWVQPGEEGMPPQGLGDAFYWLMFLVPIMGAFLVFNCVALLAVVRGRAETPFRTALLLWFVVVTLWGGTLAVDHYRSVIYVDAQYV
jgi:hypothetical protein